MTLNPHPNHPAAGAYVLRLHRDACPERGLLMGRIQHVASDKWLDFTSAEALLEWLTWHSYRLRAEPAEPVEPDRSGKTQQPTHVQTLATSSTGSGDPVNSSCKQREK